MLYFKDKAKNHERLIRLIEKDESLNIQAMFIHSKKDIYFDENPYNMAFRKTDTFIAKMKECAEENNIMTMLKFDRNGSLSLLKTQLDKFDTKVANKCNVQEMNHGHDYLVEPMFVCTAPVETLKGHTTLCNIIVIFHIVGQTAYPIHIRNFDKPEPIILGESLAVPFTI